MFLKLLHLERKLRSKWIFLNFKAALAQSNGKCVCEDQMAPKCKDGKNPTCPNGEEIDFSLDQVPDMLAHCTK